MGARTEDAEDVGAQGLLHAAVGRLEEADAVVDEVRAVGRALCACVRMLCVFE